MFKLLKNKLKDQRGLTLIELLAVIVILGIIAAIAIPAIGNLIENTQKKATVSEGLQIMNAAKLYTAEVNPDATTAKNLTNTELGAYLDKVKDTGYTVTITGKNGQYTYLLKTHSAADLVDKVTTADTGEANEQDLINYKP